jgi:hypothetical protein
MLNSPATAPLKVALIVPIFNDFASFTQLCREIDTLVPEWNAELTIIGVDDGSYQTPGPLFADRPIANIHAIELVKLRCNLGHQRAIAVGLVLAEAEKRFDAVLVADSDGEDRPLDMGRLLAEHRASSDAVIVGQRAKRSESLHFRAFYALYKFLFALLTGKKIDFGNFVLLPREALSRFVNMSECWSHLAASILFSRLPLRSVSCDRGKRYAGNSSMNLVSLLNHGLSAVAVFGEFVFARMLIASGLMTAVAVAMAAVAIFIRVTTNLAVPGWTTMVVGISLIIVSQALLFCMMASLTMLRIRSAATFIPSLQAPAYVSEHIDLLTGNPAHHDGLSQAKA